MDDFRAAYGPAGDWSRLFALAEGYLGTELLEADDTAGYFLTIDRWRSRRDWDRFLERHAEAYRLMANRFSNLHTQARDLGEFESTAP